MRVTKRNLKTIAVWIPVLLVVCGGMSASAQTQIETHDGLPAGDQDALYENQTLRVSLWTDKDEDQVYQRGEQLNVTFQTNEDAYVVLYHIDPVGRVDVLWPTSRYSDGFSFGGHRYRLPTRQGNRIRVGDEAGMGYINAVVSRYPFDIRDLELDFHHENMGNPHDYYVGGDPFLAMNEVTYAVTGLEDPSEYVITNYLTYYVHQKVDHPRYICSQCHEDDPGYDPYHSTCEVTITYDYSWANTWWDRYQYYPPYYYPVYYYVDPWCGISWVNYWYDPFYRYPTVVVNNWYGGCYSWHHSPYWRGDCWSRPGTSYPNSTRYRPLDRNRSDSGVATRTKHERIPGGRPSSDEVRIMKEKRDARASREMNSGDVRGRTHGGGSRTDYQPTRRTQTEFAVEGRTQTPTGLRVPSRTNTGSKTTLNRSPRLARQRQGIQERNAQDQGRRSGAVTGGDDSRSGGRQTIKPIPRNDGGRVWTNRRNTSSTQVRPSPQPSRSQNQPSRTPKQVQTRSNSNRNKPISGSSRSGSTVSRPPKQSTSSRSASPPPSRSSSRSGGSSKSGGSSGGKSGGRR
jgi:hypothetical protein